ncbi:Re/Si-specific NAD(P)(+) transhydrogenase subunit alpha [uncultured Varibaculum sp.]|uniref:Re/Si-specific NAD(P)(+) transhydrogenase subunit alpha n=1 Tax=uncultured Varibaculum sp. TaxID=413896 RepID=UPI002591CB0B|nr:Re/Si-specific NAD(P)(+) transhydrogenase subunit alpha [uncultured Varibaculum sp.]
MRIGVPKEPTPDQTLVAATPDTVKKLSKLGYEVLVEQGAGEKAAYLDEQYLAAGAQIVDTQAAWQADIVTVLDTPPANYLDLIRPGALLIARMAPARHPETVDALVERGITGFAMDTVPRISRAQSMDVLSSMSNVSGYRAVIEAAESFGRLFTGQVTAAGKIPPAKVYVIGVGVAGLAAIGTANSMGAQVSATDVRSETAEQAESVGATFVPIPIAQEKSDDGYAKEMSADQADAATKLYTEQAAANDIVITTANIPGRRSPLLITKEAVAAMAPGSVIVDMAAAGGGNCELTRPGEKVVTENGVTIIGYTDLAGRLPGQSSQLYGQNIVNLFKLITPEKDGNYVLDMEDEVVRGITVSKGGENMFPPPPIKVHAAPAPEKTESVADAAEMARKKAEAAASKKRKRLLWAAVGIVLGLALIAATPKPLIPYYFILMLAIVVGFYVITSVTHSLHTPLMSETNAISGIILVGAILQVGSANPLVSALSFLAILVASINIFGGFSVTHRMLAMFRGEEK